MCCRWCQCVLGGVSVLQMVSVCSRWCQCATGGVSVLQVVSVCCIPRTHTTSLCASVSREQK